LKWFEQYGIVSPLGLDEFRMRWWVCVVAAPQGRTLIARVAVRVGGEVAARLTYGRRTVCVRDMMIDRVASLPGVRPLILTGPSAVIDGDVGGDAV